MLVLYSVTDAIECFFYAACPFFMLLMFHTHHYPSPLYLLILLPLFYLPVLWLPTLTPNPNPNLLTPNSNLLTLTPNLNSHLNS
jgi:hypothetical protein